MVQIEVDHVTKRIHKNTVLQDVTAVMHEGRIYGLQGVNGSGKTMLMRMIIGLIRPSEGRVSINGRVLGKDIEFPESIGFLLENPAFLGRYSGFDNLNMLAGIRRLAAPEQIRESIRAVGLDPMDRKKYRKYSLGMIGLVKGILTEQKQRGALVIVSCHDIGILKELSDEIFRLDAGRVVEHLCLDSAQ